jgi:uncharacterized protein YndB with AHSA1/START domain
MKILKIIAISLAALVVIFLTIGIINPVFDYGNTIVINAPSRKVWSLYTDQKEHWIEGLKSHTLMSGNPLTKDAEYETTIVSGEAMVMQEKIKAIIPGERIEWTLDNDVLISRYSYTFLGDSSKTEVTTHYDVEGKNLFMKSILNLSKGFLKSSDADMLSAMKKLAEKKTNVL